MTVLTATTLTATTLTATTLLAGCGVTDSPAVRTAQAATRAADSAFGGELATFEALSGTRYLWATVRSRRTSESGFSSGYGGYAPVRNYLFYDPEPGRAQWLLSAEPVGAPPRQITAHVLVSPPAGTPAGAAGVDVGPASVGNSALAGITRGVLYEIRERDTNGDGSVDGDDQAVLTASAPDGTGYQQLLPAVRQYLGAFWRADGSAVVLYTGPVGPRAATVDVGQRRVVHDVALPGAPPL